MRGDFLLNAVKRAGQQQITRNRTDQECQNRGDDRRHQTFDKMGDDLEHQIGDNRADDDGDRGLSSCGRLPYHRTNWSNPDRTVCDV